MLVTPRAGGPHGQPVSALLPLSAELQGGAGADRPAEPGQHGECSRGSWLAPCPSAGTAGGCWAPRPFPRPQTHVLAPGAPHPTPNGAGGRGGPRSPSCFVPILCPPSPGVPPIATRLPPPPVAMVFSFSLCLPQCFMNSILQCLSNTRELRDYCLQNQYLRDLNNNSRMRTALMAGNGTPPAGRAPPGLGGHRGRGHPRDTRPRPRGAEPRLRTQNSPS